MDQVRITTADLDLDDGPSGRVVMMMAVVVLLEHVRSVRIRWPGGPGDRQSKAPPGRNVNSQIVIRRGCRSGAARVVSPAWKRS